MLTAIYSRPYMYDDSFLIAQLPEHNLENDSTHRRKYLQLVSAVVAHSSNAKAKRALRLLVNRKREGSEIRDGRAGYDHVGGLRGERREAPGIVRGDLGSLGISRRQGASNRAPDSLFLYILYNFTLSLAIYVYTRTIRTSMYL